jgi:hypothetical protein
MWADFGNCFVTGIFGSWILLSVLVYVPKLQTFIRRWDWFALIPEWRFFAPNPGQHDYHLLYRDKLRDGSITDWTELTPTKERPWWGFVWNPGKRGNKALFDAVATLAKHMTAGDQSMELSIPFLTLLNYVASVPRPSASEYTQLLVLASHGSPSRKDPELFFLSGYHSL